MPTLDESLIGLQHSDRSISWSKALPSGTGIGFHIRELRRETTGIHGMVAVGLEDGTPLAFDEFNLKRDKDRNHLAGRVHKRLGAIDSTTYSSMDVAQDIDTLCLWVLANWEQRSFKVERFDRNGTLPQLQPFLKPYIYDGMGSILFAPPGQGKSYILQIMAICVANGLEFPWPCVPAPVLYASFERTKRTLEIRERNICDSLGITDSHVDYLHARGHSLKAVAPKIREYAKENPGCVVLLDSITRVGLGKMVEDTTANAFIDEMNSLNSWIALAHTPKADSTTQYGSMGYEAGEDIGIHLQGEQRGNSLGIKLEMVKVNDIKKAPAEYLTLGFGPNENDGLVSIQRASHGEYPGLALTGRDKLEHIKDLCLKRGKASVSQISDDTGIPRTTVGDYVKDEGIFYKHPKDGKEVFYSVKTSQYS
jgi:hypothetical protein